MATTTIDDALAPLQQRVERTLEHWLPRADAYPARLHRAMRYAVLGNGKRVRPALLYATGNALELPCEALDGPACAVELIHAYSLIHDDLPAMDDDVLRRGKPTCHMAFDEATAILAGDALQALAFYILSHDETMTPDTSARLAMVEMLAGAAGSHGMAGGQAIDLAAVGASLSIDELKFMHRLKTGALIRASVMLAVASKPQVSRELAARLDRYAQCIGLAFQIRDDVLDVESDTETLGKCQGADAALEKPTFPALLGMDEAKTQANALCEEALGCLCGLGEGAELLHAIARFIVSRIN
ncbi:MAG: polyprenyl synthetase family protein [Gammaproteobacteria bacterium]